MRNFRVPDIFVLVEMNVDHAPDTIFWDGSPINVREFDPDTAAITVVTPPSFQPGPVRVYLAVAVLSIEVVTWVRDSTSPPH